MHLHMLLWIPTFSVGACAKAEEDGEPCEEWREGERQKRKRGGEGGREDNIQEQGSKIRTKTTLITMASFHCEAIQLCSWKYWQELYLVGSLVLLFIKDWQTSIWWSPSLGMPCRCACISAHMRQLSCKRETYLTICTLSFIILAVAFVWSVSFEACLTSPTFTLLPPLSVGIFFGKED